MHRTPKRTSGLVLLLGPGGKRERGGMGQVIRNLDELWRADPAGPRFAILDSRGTGHVLWSPAYLLVAMIRFIWYAASDHVELIHIHVSERGSVARKYLAMKLAHLLGVPVVLHLHGAEFIAFYNGSPPWIRKRVDWMFRTARRSIVLGNVWRRFVIDHLGADPQQVVIVYNGVPTARERNTLRTGGACHVLFLGTLGNRKGVPELLNAVAAEPLRSRDWRLTLAGSGELARFRSLSAELGVAERTRFTGWLGRDAVAELMVTADLLVLPSHDEGLPMVVLEALSAGIPVVTTPVGALSEVLETERNALLVPPGDVASLTRALDRLVADTDLRIRLGREGRALFDQRFSLQRFAERLNSVYAECAV